MIIDKRTRELFRDPGKRRAWVRYQITLQGRSMADVARDAGVSRQCLYQVFCKTYPHMEKVVADAVGLEPKVLFPDRYHADGLPIYRRGRPKKSTTSTVSIAAGKPGRNVTKSVADRQAAST